MYWEMMKNGPPKFCHTCDFYFGNGVCDKHKMRPPDEFTQTENACEQWEQTIPF